MNAFPKRSVAALLIGSVFAGLAGEVFAQPPGGRGWRARSVAPAPSEDEPATTPPTPTAPVDFPSSLMLGEVPAFWEIDAAKREEALEAVLLEGSIAPPVPAKVVRYAAAIMEKYDANGNGVLEKEEWSRMSGAPQSIDLNGDAQVTLEELVRHIAVYGQGRTIHRPYPAARSHRPMVGSGAFQLFKPLSALPESATAQTASDAAATNGGVVANGQDRPGPVSADATGDMTAESLEKTETITDEAAFERLAAANRAPAEKKFYRPIEELRGLPAWFILRDRDGDGQISMEEFAPSLTPAALALFGKLDKNGDGLLTTGEIRQEQPVQGGD